MHVLVLKSYHFQKSTPCQSVECIARAKLYTCNEHAASYTYIAEILYIFHDTIIKRQAMQISQCHVSQEEV